MPPICVVLASKERNNQDFFSCGYGMLLWGGVSSTQSDAQVNTREGVISKGEKAQLELMAASGFRPAEVP